MLYNSDGEILWHKGRNIVGKNVFEGDGFSKSYIHRSLQENVGIDRENVTVDSSGLSQSAYLLNVKALLIQPVGDGFFLYIDSGVKRAFSESDREVFKTIGELLGLMIRRIKKNQTDFGGITGQSGIIESIRRLVLHYSLEEQPVLLLGETGVGKSHIARLVHRYSGRKGEFITVNTPSLSDSLFESELFGHKKGAFTDACNDKRGYVDEAAGGTLFFDEISEVPVSFQARMLRFIETKKYQILGDPVEREADVRIIAATNRNMAQAIEQKEFREDLYYRLQVLEIRIPPLRERKEDLKALVQENLGYLKGKQIGAGFWDILLNHSWPGNVRELITLLIRVGILCQSPITGRQIREIIMHGVPIGAEPETDPVKRILRQIDAGGDFWQLVRKPFLNRDLNRDQVKRIIANYLEQQEGKYKHVLSSLNIAPSEHKKFLNFLNDNKLKP